MENFDDMGGIEMFLLKLLDDLLCGKEGLCIADNTLIDNLKARIDALELEKAALDHELSQHKISMLDCPTVINAKLFQIFSIERRVDCDEQEVTVVTVNTSCNPEKAELQDEYYFISRDAHKNLVKCYLENKDMLVSTDPILCGANVVI